MTKYIVKDEEHQIRIDKALKEIAPEYSRSLVSKMIEDELIKVNGLKTKNNYVLKINDEITIGVYEEKEVDIVAKDMDLDIVYQDNDVAIVNKETGVVVHPALGNYDNTLVNGLMHQLDNLSGIKGEVRPGIVHRIDKDTSGLLMIAKNDNAHEKLSSQLKDHTVNRLYVGLCSGVISCEHGRIEAPIGRDPKDRKKMAVVDGGKSAITNFRVIERYKKATLVEFKLETGRTHQIRVHMKYIGFPLIGDTAYGFKKQQAETGQYLHAKTLGFIHPTTNKYMEFNCDMPSYFKDKINELKEE